MKLRFGSRRDPLRRYVRSTDGIRDNPYGAFNFIVRLGNTGGEDQIVGGFSDVTGDRQGPTLHPIDPRRWAVHLNRDVFGEFTVSSERQKPHLTQAV